jgi:NADPH2:quinone reductase
LRITVRLVIATAFGGPEVLEVRDLAEPPAGPGEVEVTVVVVPVLFLDTQIRAGRARAWFEVTPPYVPGAGVAGTVTAVGLGVYPAWVGCPVVASTPQGRYRSRAIVSAEDLVAVPHGVGVADAAALLHDGRTALGLMELAAPRPGEWVLVLGAAGGLVALLVQLAAHSGARVLGAARGQRKLDMARKYGAEAVVDYTDADWSSQVRTVVDVGAAVVVEALLTDPWVDQGAWRPGRGGQ